MRAKLPHTTGYVECDGVKIHYEIYGDGPKTIIFVPTWAIIHSRSWKAQIPYFAEQFRVIAYDPRGNGKSDRPDRVEDYNFGLVVGDVTAVMDATETEKAILVGLSFSSAVAYSAAAKYPERIEAVISIGASTPIVPPLATRKIEFGDGGLGLHFQRQLNTLLTLEGLYRSATVPSGHQWRVSNADRCPFPVFWDVL